jgi:hypothetical protein
MRAAVKAVAEKLQDIVSGGSLRMTVGLPGLPHRAGAAGLAQGHQPAFNAAKVSQAVQPPAAG